ncbi:MAG: DUF4153 domain-containing protein [Gaiellaceae bacterium]
MSRATKAALLLAALALVLGILGDLLFQGQPLGLNAALWATGFVVALMLLLRYTRSPLHQGRRLMVAPLLLFAALLVWHDAPLLVAANLLAVGAAVSMGALRTARRPLRRATLSDYGGGLAGAAVSAVVGAAALLMRDIRWTEVVGTARSRRVSAIVRGLALGAPLLLIFGALFVAADAVFQSLVSSAIPTLDAGVVERLLLIGTIAWLAGGLLRDLLAARGEDEEVSFPSGRRLGDVEVGIPLGVLNLLFLAFVVVQFRYLFGGRGLVESETGLTYAEYARHGFFELVAVAVLTLPLLLAGDWLLRDGTRGRRAFRLLAASLLALLGVVMASALERMRLYMNEYGLTELRLYATGVILWLAVVCIWFAVTVLRGKRHAFAVGALVTGFAATFALNLINPDALIARTNITRPAVDVPYIANLSDDAVPTLVDQIWTLPAAQRQQLAQALLARESAWRDWRSWNLARTRADAALSRRRAELSALARAPASRP